MKRILLTILAIGLLSSCNNDDEEEVLGTFIWAPNISVSLSDGSAVLFLNDPRPYTEYVAPGPENPDYFEVFMGEDLENFELFKRLDNFTELVNIDELENGKDYFFKVIAHRNGFDSAGSNTVMTIPSKEPKLEAYSLGTELSVQGLSLSSDIMHMSFYSSNYLNGERTSDLLVMDKSSGDIESLGYSSFSAHWGNNINLLAYLSTKLIGNTLYGDKVNIYNADTKENIELFNVDFDNYYVDSPIFEPGDGAISFLSSKGNSEIFIHDLWSIDLETKEETKLSDFDGIFYAGAYDWVSSGKEIYIGGSLSIEEYTENIFKYEIETKELLPVIESQWRDTRPSLSPDDSKLAFISNRSSFNDDIWLYDFTTAKYRRLTGNLPQRRFFASTSNLSWVDNNHLLVTINNLDNTKQEAYTIEAQ